MGWYVPRLRDPRQARSCGKASCEDQSHQGDIALGRFRFLASPNFVVVGRCKGVKSLKERKEGQGKLQRAKEKRKDVSNTMASCSPVLVVSVCRVKSQNHTPNLTPIRPGKAARAIEVRTRGVARATSGFACLAHLVSFKTLFHHEDTLVSLGLDVRVKIRASGIW